MFRPRLVNILKKNAQLSMNSKSLTPRNEEMMIYSKNRHLFTQVDDSNLFLKRSLRWAKNSRRYVTLVFVTRIIIISLHTVEKWC